MIKQEQLASFLSGIFGADKVTYYDFGDKDKAPNPPFVAYLFDGSYKVDADNKTYFREDSYRIELYVKRTDYQSEKLLEMAFDDDDIPYTKLDKILNEDTQLFEVIYTI